jgi:hypothetical protein
MGNYDKLEKCLDNPGENSTDPKVLTEIERLAEIDKFIEGFRKAEADNERANRYPGEKKDPEITPADLGWADEDEMIAMCDAMGDEEFGKELERRISEYQENHPEINWHYRIEKKSDTKMSDADLKSIAERDKLLEELRKS